MSIKTDNHAMKEAYTVFVPNHTDPIVIPEGTFVSPIEKRYVPKHVLDDPRWNFVNLKEEIFVYTKWGILPVPRRLVVVR